MRYSFTILLLAVIIFHGTECFAAPRTNVTPLTICAKSDGKLLTKPRCRRSEIPIDLPQLASLLSSQVGIQGPKGDPGPSGLANVTTKVSISQPFTNVPAGAGIVYGFGYCFKDQGETRLGGGCESSNPNFVLIGSTPLDEELWSCSFKNTSANPVASVTVTGKILCAQ